MNTDTTMTPREIGQRIKERRKELSLTMLQLGDRLGVNKSTIQRYETQGIDPKKNYLIVSLADALETTPEWLMGASDQKEPDRKSVLETELDDHIQAYLEVLTTTIQGNPRQQMLNSFLGELIDLYAVFCGEYAFAMKEVKRAAADEGLQASLRKYAIEAGPITEQIYKRELEPVIEDMKRFLDGILHIYDEGRDKVKMGSLLEIKQAARERLERKRDTVAPE